jgi:uncharacterized membrane protein YuzA (DUF378 family)
MNEMILLIIPLAAIQVGLLGFALYDLVKRNKVKGGNKILWGVVIVLVNIIGPILYLTIGREED